MTLAAPSCFQPLAQTTKYLSDVGLIKEKQKTLVVFLRDQSFRFLFLKQHQGLLICFALSTMFLLFIRNPQSTAHTKAQTCQILLFNKKREF